MRLGIAIQSSSLLVAAVATCFIVSASAASEKMVILVKYQDNALQVLGSKANALPLHYAGHYIEWTNEREFVEKHKLFDQATYTITASVERVESRKFPEGWGERTGRNYSTYFLKALSARLSGKK